MRWWRDCWRRRIDGPFYSGVMLETRIWGELGSFTAVAAVLLLEDHVEQRRGSLEMNSANRRTPEMETESQRGS